MGYNKDTSAGVILEAWKIKKKTENNATCYEDEDEDRAFIKVDLLNNFLL